MFEFYGEMCTKILQYKIKEQTEDKTSFEQHQCTLENHIHHLLVTLVYSIFS